MAARTSGAAEPLTTVRLIDRVAAAHDASHYLRVPEAVARPKDAAGVSQLFRYGRERRLPLTFRSGGTSLSGQGVTGGLLVDTRRHFRRVTVLDDGRRVRTQPGATVRQVNAHLARHRRKLGPDPASEIACTIGGVVANNSSGMACGTERNTYRTLESAVFVLPSGTIVDTGCEDADARLRADEPVLWQGLAGLRDRVRGDAESVATVRRLFAMKNTMGYGVNALLDFDRPVDILAHLMVGSEGTLGFVAEATFRTVEILPYAATGLAVLPDLRAATAVLPDLVALGPATVELMDATSLRVARALDDPPAVLAALDVREHAALLIEFHGADQEALDARVAACEKLLGPLCPDGPPVLSADPATRAGLWHVRKGLYTAVAGARPSGTTALLEDVAVPVPALLETCEELTALFERHGYQDTVIFGHAKDGNIHFMLNERFDDPACLDRYRAFTEDMVELVLRHGGTLKAEHGTGRIMAPFVRHQYGAELHGVMREIKRLCDPHGLLNPGVLLSDDPDSYLADLKTTPAVEEEVDRCVECGYCEPACPSKDLTLTPRQRIVVRREMRGAQEAGDTGRLAELAADYAYEGVDTCAVDGMCQPACPVGINTGDLVRRLRAQNAAGTAEQAVWTALSKHWDPVTRGAGAALTAARLLPAPLTTAVTRAGRALAGADTLPLYGAGLPRGGATRRPVAVPDAVAVHFPACIGTMFGPAPGGEGASHALRTLCDRAGVRLSVPEGIGGLCCGTPWKSKGHTPGYEHMAGVVLPALLAASDGGRLPVVCDAASCTEGLETMRAQAGEEFAALRFADAVAFAHEHLLDRLTVRHPVDSVALHLTCSSTRLGVNDQARAIARAVSPQVHEPVDWSCCAFAGDRGLLRPELTASATKAESAEVNKRNYAAYASVNRTCELGMTRATGHEYRHVLELLEEATRP
ncbi:FAD-binding and (Fe-S)-binding domain-containing protein [Streptantibioticus silvisoli]|uniref:D-lactate dehydrogenase (cytochrome) n=1 Tax=Streptantibioticus silvisoli TaxID=2705255 RepID=A0ABT6W413_9ACTN|nr:FAD-binding and (Fe-S)-binding domain-containing protein [Streptantibioticus silvisoli]MDI5965490.1 FAD-binding and (Fe-S)-binding domain-containing protein [Streptantibioticus silvisoli]